MVYDIWFLLSKLISLIISVSIKVKRAIYGHHHNYRENCSEIRRWEIFVRLKGMKHFISLSYCHKRVVTKEFISLYLYSKVTFDNLRKM